MSAADLVAGHMIGFLPIIYSVVPVGRRRNGYVCFRLQHVWLCLRTAAAWPAGLLTAPSDCTTSTLARCVYSLSSADPRCCLFVSNGKEPPNLARMNRPRTKVLPRTETNPNLKVKNVQKPEPFQVKNWTEPKPKFPSVLWHWIIIMSISSLL